MKIYTPEEFAELMKTTVELNLGDEEECHMQMDTNMCYLLKALGYEKGVEIFLNTPKWYA